MADDLDLLHGVKAIAAALNTSERRAQHLLETGRLAGAAFKIDWKWCARRSKLREHIERLEQGAA
jgi:hypothetical protein